MFLDWMIAGVAFGFKAFFAALVFLLCMGIVLGVLGAFARALGGGDDDDLDRD